MQGKSEMRLIKTWDADTEEYIYTPKQADALGINDKWKAEVIESYFAHKAGRLAKDNQLYHNLGIPDLMNEINTHSLYRESLVEEAAPKNEYLQTTLAAFEDGTLKRTKANVNAYNKIVKELEALQAKADASHKVMLGKLDPETRKLIDGYVDLNNNVTNLQAYRLRFLENTSFGKEMMEKQEAQLAANAYYEKRGIQGMLHQEAPIVAYQHVIGFVQGLADLGVTIGGSIRKKIDPSSSRDISDQALLIHDAMDTFSTDYIKNFGQGSLVSSKPVVDPVTGEVDMMRIVPGTVGTVVDMVGMIYGSKGMYAGAKMAGSVAKKGLLKAGATSKSLTKVGKAYKGITSHAATAASSVPIILPQKLTEAYEQIDKDFTSEDALDYAIQATLVEAAIETLNPEWKWTKKSLAAIRKGKDVSQSVLSAFKNARKKAFVESLKTVPVEWLEEFSQNLAGGAISMAYNNTFDTDFKIPDSNEYNETAILTATSVLTMRGLSGNLVHQNNNGLLRIASENYEGFIKVLNQNMVDGKISEKEAQALLNNVDEYTLRSGEINDILFDKDGDVIVTEQQADELIGLLTTRNALEAQIKEADPKLKKKLQKELDAVNQQVNNQRNVIKSTSSTHDLYKAEYEIKKIQEKLKDSKLTPEGKKELQKQLTKQRKEAKKHRAKTPEYIVNNEVFNTRKEFLAAINRHKMNGNLKRGTQLDIKVKNDFEAEAQAYEIMNKYAPKSLAQKGGQDKVVMSKNQETEIVKSLDPKKTDEQNQADTQLELNKEQQKKPQAQNKEKIQQLKDTLTYFDLKKAGYVFGAKGFLVQPTVMTQNELRDLRLEGNIEAVRKATEQFGGGLEVLTNEEALAKYGRQVTGANGFFVPKYDKNGKLTGFAYVINKEVAKYQKARSVASHEMLHGLLYSLINGPMRKITDKQGKPVWVKMSKEGKELLEGFLTILPQDQIDILNAKLDKGGYRFTKYDANGVGVPGTKLSFEEYGEEYLNMYHEAVITDKSIPVDTKENKNIFRKIIDFFNNIFIHYNIIIVKKSHIFSPIGFCIR